LLLSLTLCIFEQLLNQTGYITRVLVITNYSEALNLTIGPLLFLYVKRSLDPSGHWNFMGATTWKTPGFDANDLGYFREADQVLTVLWTQYNQFEPKWIYRDYSINWDVIRY
jgi:hypothetical protein